MSKKRKKPNEVFVPTEQERRFVAVMAGLRMGVDDICKVIGSHINEGRPLAKQTLYKDCLYELANGAALLHSLVGSKFHEAIAAGAPWAIQCALRNLPGYRFDRYNEKNTPFIANNARTRGSELRL